MRFSRALIAIAVLATPVLVAARVDAQSAKVDQKTACLECHDDVATALGSVVGHAPARSGKCTACHNPHAARQPGLLLDRPAILCARCHRELGREMSRSVVHAPVAEGRCGECHEPHGAPFEGLLSLPAPELCGECHEQVDRWRGYSYQHSPFRRNRCRDCHEPHASDFPGLATEAGAQMCLRCHPASTKFLSIHKGYPVQQAGCHLCHDPHASSRDHLFRAFVHEPFGTGDCAICHVNAGQGPEPFALSAREDSLCGECHDEQVEAARTSLFPHVAGGGTGCTACHNPHTATGKGLLRGDTRAVCLSCHDPGGAKSGQQGRFTGHGGDLTCTLCHNPHGSQRPALLVTDPVQLCGECHSHQHSIAHPMGDESPDPRTGQPLDCLSCHGIHEAPHDKYLHRDGDRDLCIGCHKELGAR